MDRPFPAYQGEEPYVFVSYSHSNTSAVFPELISLNQSGFNIWYDDGIEAGSEWTDTLALAIKKAKLFLYFVTPESAQSQNCRNEVNFAIAHDIPIIAVHLEQTKLQDGLSLALSSRQAIFKYKISNEDYQQKMLSGISFFIGQPNIQEGEKGRKDSGSMSTGISGMKSLYLAAAGILGVLAVVGFLNIRNPTTTPAIQIDTTDAKKSIVVLPLINLSSDAEQEFFSDGITEELMIVLARNPNLNVISRSSSFWFKGRERNIPNVVERLGVDYVLDGSVRKAIGSDEIRISVQLIDAAEDSVLWSQTFNRKLDNVFVLQDEIASNVMRRMNVSILNTNHEAQTVNPEAYILFLQAHHFLGQSKPIEATRLLTEALEIDPNYGRAWVELSRSYLQLSGAGEISLEERLQLSDAALQRALAIGNDDNVVYSFQGWHAIFDEHDFAKAARLYERALELDPTHVDTLRGLVPVALNFGKYSDALVIAEFVVQQDPLCTICISNLVRAHWAVGQFEDAVTVAGRLAALNPRNNGRLGSALLLGGEPETALAIFEQMNPPSLAYIPMAQYSLGLVAEFETSLESFVERFPDADLALAQIYAWSGDVDRAFEKFDKAFASDRLNPAWFFNPFLSNLTSDSRWLSYLERDGRSPEQLDAIGFEIALPE